MNDFNKFDNSIKFKNFNNLFLGSSKIDKKYFELLSKNPHCIEYFINNKNIINCSNCMNSLLNSKKIYFNNIFEKDFINTYKKVKRSPYLNKVNEYCDNKCVKNTFIYPIKKEEWETNINSEIDIVKEKLDFVKKTLVYTLNDLPIIKTQTIFPRPMTVIHWGQMKMFLNTLEFLIKKNKESYDEINIIYPGSARGDNILLLCKMFPNTKWYLIDPQKFHEDLYNHKQIIECRNELFTDELAKYYNKKLKNKFKLFISDIRFATDDNSIIKDQNSNYNWFKLIDADYAWLKFRCPYNINIYNYYEGDIYMQPYAKQNSSESRLLLTKHTKVKEYNVNEYVGKFYYFNRILRPSYYDSYIKDHEIIDHCWDCVCFQYIIKNYITNFPNFNYFKTDNIRSIVDSIINFISLKTINRINEKNKLILSRLSYS